MAFWVPLAALVLGTKRLPMFAALEAGETAARSGFWLSPTNDLPYTKRQRRRE